MEMLEIHALMVLIRRVVTITSNNCHQTLAAVSNIVAMSFCIWYLSYKPIHAWELLPLN